LGGDCPIHQLVSFQLAGLLTHGHIIKRLWSRMKVKNLLIIMILSAVMGSIAPPPSPQAESDSHDVQFKWSQAVEVGGSVAIIGVS